MCGIAGSVNVDLPVSLAKASLSHRGPDEQTHLVIDNLCLVHARLAIQELSPAGRQPMTLNGLTIIFNGEIYNHYELRRKHQLNCVSHSDTETLLHLYLKLGDSMLGELDGMFALALFDQSKKTLLLARDRAGEKPFYYYTEGDKFVFASELQLLQKILKPSPEDTLMANFLAVGYLLPGQTPYRSIFELQAGCKINLSLDTVKPVQTRWWSIDEKYNITHSLSIEEALERTEQLLQTSIQRRISSSDLEVGTFLSGGIDSGLVTAFASRLNSQLRSFTVAFEGMFNEGDVAASVAKHLGTRHTQLTISLSQLESDIEGILSRYGEPIMDDSVIPSYYVSREARKNLIVILNGDAGDELFGGYRRYVPFSKFDFFRNPASLAGRALRTLLPAPADKMSSYNYAYRLINLFSHRGPEAYFSATNDLMHDKCNWFQSAPDLRSYCDYITRVTGKNTSALKKIMEIDFGLLLETTLLVKMDIATMANSLESRSPFLSKELLDFVPGLPDRFKIHGSTTKVLLRKLAEKHLPKGVSSLPKRGFETPLTEWMDTRLKPFTLDLVNSPRSYVRQLLTSKAVDDILAGRVLLSRDRRARILFSWLSLEIWKRSIA